MENNFTERFETITKDLEDLKVKKIKAEEALKVAQKEEKELIAQMKELGVTPDTIEDEVHKLATDLEKQLKEIETELETLEEVASNLEEDVEA